MADLRSRHTFAICAYGESPYLEACIQSILKQSTASNVLIATSTPCGYIQTLAERYGIPVKVNGAKKGIGGDWNFALSCCRTPYVTLAHQDDIYEPDYGKVAVEMLGKAQKPLIFFCDYAELRSGKKTDHAATVRVKRWLLFPLRFRVFQNNRWIRRRILSLGNAVCCPSVTYSLMNLPQPLFTGSMKSNLDWLAWEELSRHKGAFVYCPRTLMCHRIHGESTTSRLLSANGRSREDYQVFCRFWPKRAARILTKLYQNAEKSNDL